MGYIVPPNFHSGVVFPRSGVPRRKHVHVCYLDVSSVLEKPLPSTALCVTPFIPPQY